MRFFAAYSLRGRYQALLVVCGFAWVSLILPPVSLLSSALFALIVLRRGGAEGIWVMAFAVLCLGVGGALLGGDFLQGMIYGLLLWAPTWPVAVVLRESRSLALASETALALGLAVVLGVYALVDNPAALWRETVQTFAQSFSQNAPDDFDAVAFGAALGKTMDVVAPYFTGMVVGGSVLSLFLGLFIARWWQANLFNPGGFGREFAELRLHPAVVYAGIACLCAALLLRDGNFAVIAWNLNSVFVVVFILAGISILHASILGGKGIRTFFFYLALIFALMLWNGLILIVALLGISDIWLDWRKLGKRF